MMHSKSEVVFVSNRDNLLSLIDDISDIVEDLMGDMTELSRKDICLIYPQPELTCAVHVNGVFTSLFIYLETTKNRRSFSLFSDKW